MRDVWLAVIAVAAFGSLFMLEKIHFDLDMISWNLQHMAGRS